MPYWKFASLAVCTVAICWLLGYRLTEKLAADSGVSAMFAGGFISLVASLLGALPIVLVRDRQSVEATVAALKSLAFRFGLVLLISAVVAFKGLFSPTPFLLWVVISHLALLFVDTWFACSQNRLVITRKEHKTR